MRAVQFLSSLSRLPMAGAQHWQGLDHLGELRNVLKCGHHSRYEYLLLQLYLIHIFKERAEGVRSIFQGRASKWCGNFQCRRAPKMLGDAR